MKIRFGSREELDAALASGAFDGQAVHMVIVHDDDCVPGQCTCSPDYMLEDLQAERYVTLKRAAAKWRKGARS